MTVRSDSQGGDVESTSTAEAAESVSGYRDLARIGHGGFSVVYRAVQESFERDVALKVLTVGTDEDAQRRFLREVRLASKLSGHPHVVTVLDTGTTASGRPYLAMDLYDGGSMKERLRRSGPLPAADVALLGAKVADALAAAHSLGVLHRDVKPNNILVSRFGEPALADFGVSCLLDSNASASVLDVFSPQHAAPELMARGVPSVSSDVYALGSTLYELLTGKPPFGADSRDVRAIMWRAMTEPAPRPDCPELPGLADAIVRAMAKEPADRFPDAADFAKTLRALIPDGGGSATLAMTVVAPAAGASAGADAASPTSILSAEPEADTGTGPGERSATYTGRHTGPQAEPAPVLGLDPDDTFSGRVRGGVDETMVRPDRVGPEPDPKARKKRGAAAGGAAGGIGAGTPAVEGEEGRHRGRTPLIVLVALCLLGGAVWVVLDSQNSSTGAKAEASAHTPIPTKAAAGRASESASAKPKASASHTATHSAEPTVAKTTHSAAASATATASASSTSSSGGLLGLGTYYQFKSALSGNCLTASGSSAGQQSCGGGASQSWEFTEPVTGILNSLAGDFELVNKATGECLDASGGSVGTASCDGGTEQLWSTVSGSSGEEIHNAGDSLCLTSSGSGVVAGACSTSESADLWAQS
ncbi:protein kinase [Actinospica sp. MGRD01-02]|uniref:non-specific serine/threonine protein kinase n=1 Tax=Actinospica acidithermotolerans TaxID=2828514 RepID=A0A941IMS7_9ACTN|nr:serine/threonine protein kinase [Actinospica acidithermotolerans]MBR7828836.1 protein kinase [Actinospica acidithermotolerans]